MSSELIGQWCDEVITQDDFCWDCDKKCGELKIMCAKCFRSFHDQCCIESSRPVTVGGICAVCSTLERSKCCGTEQHVINEIVKRLFRDIYQDTAYTTLRDLQKLEFFPKYKEQIANHMDFPEIIKKILNHSYVSFYEFLVDIRCILHNCTVYYGESGITKTAKKLHDFCTQFIVNCVGCFKNKISNPCQWMSIVCEQPHLLLWAKLSESLNVWQFKIGFEHWPAKLISVAGSKIEVLLFNGKTIHISTNDCSLYSIASPFYARFSSSKIERVKLAFEATKMYIKNAMKSFDRVVDNLPITPFDGKPFDEHMKAMFPRYNGAKKRQSVPETIEIPPKRSCIVDNKTQDPGCSSSTAQVQTSPNSGSDEETSTLAVISNVVQSQFNKQNDFEPALLSFIEYMENDPPNQVDSNTTPEIDDILSTVKNMLTKYADNKTSTIATLRQQLEEAKTTHTTEMAENELQVGSLDQENRDLLENLLVESLAREDLEHELNRVKNNHEAEMNALRDEAKKNIDIVRAEERKNGESLLNRAKEQHDQDLNDANSKIQRLLDTERLTRAAHNLAILRLQDEYDKKMKTQLRPINDRVEEIEEKNQSLLAKLNDITANREELKLQVNRLQAENMLLKSNADRDRNERGRIADLRIKHDNEIEITRQIHANQINTLIKKHQEDIQKLSGATISKKNHCDRTKEIFKKITERQEIRNANFRKTNKTTDDSNSDLESQREPGLND